jgi:hypothetical protein
MANYADLVGGRTSSRKVVSWCCLVAALAVACGEPQPAAFPSQPAATDEQPDPGWETEESAADNDDAVAEEVAPAPEGKKKPEFKEGMGVEEAISAVPSDYEYVGLDQDVLAKPLTQLETYQECKVKPSDKFKVRIAVWDGKVVGANVTSTNKVLAQCIDGVVRRLEYKDKVESINTVEYTF